jgi:hypothetical protein
MTEHIGDIAALYVLGALPERELHEVDAHVSTCADCARTLGEAEIAVADIEDARAVPARALLAPRSPRLARSVFAALAAAALLAIFAASSVLQNIRLREQAAQTSGVLAVLAASHFNHVSFVRPNAAAPVAKLIYAKHGEWLYLIVEGTPANLTLYGETPTGERFLGSPQSRAGVETLFISHPGRFLRVELRQPGHPPERALLAY